MIANQRPKRRTSVGSLTQDKRKRSVLGFLASLLLTLFLLLVIGLCSWLLYQRLTQDAFLPLKRVVLLRPLIYADGNQLTEKVQHFGRNDLLQIDVSLLAAELRKQDWVKSIVVSKEWPDALRIDVQERVPLLRWGDRHFLDNEAAIFALPESPALAMLFPVHGPQGSEAQVLDMYLHLNPWLNAQGLPLRRLLLDERHVWHLYLANGIEVILGREELNKRLKKLVVIKEKMLNRYGQYISTLDLRYADGFSVRWKAGVSPVSEKAKNEKAGK